MKNLFFIIITTAWLLLEQGTAGILDSPTPPSQGSGMYSLQQIYDYLLYGTPLTVPTAFESPSSGPGPTMKTLKEIGDDIKAQFDQCDATPSDVTTGKKFFCTQAMLWGVQTGLEAREIVNLLKTGQTNIYRSGDDGTYQKGVDFNYLDNGDGTVTDMVTGLMWPSDGDGAGCANGIKTTWEVAIDWADNLVFAGYSDWRVPNLRELFSLVNTGRYNPTIDVIYFQNTNISEVSANKGYWTSTTYPHDFFYAWRVFFSDGHTDPTHKINIDCYMRAVRGGK